MAAPSPRTIPVRWLSNGPAAIWSGRLERIEPDKNQLGDRVVSARQDALVTAGTDALEGVPDRVGAGGAGVGDDLAGGGDPEGFLRVHDGLLGRVVGDQRSGVAGGGCLRV